MNRQKGTINYDRFTIPYRVYGSGSKTMVCVNGAQQTMAAWRSVVSRFRRDYSVVTFDLPGHGKSEILSPPLAVSLDEQVTCLHQIVLATHETDTLHILGASWGTIIVAAYAARYPDVPDKLILGSFGLKPSGEMLSVIQHGRALYECDRGRDAAHLIIERFGQQISEGHKDRIVSQFKAMHADQLRCFYEHCDFVQNIGHVNELVELSRITARTLVINGAKDTILSARDLELAAAQIPGCETRIVENAGHFLHFEQPEILRIYEAFLAEPTEPVCRSTASHIERELPRFAVARASRRLGADNAAAALDALAVPDPAR